jgi:AraC-like DNA-binding protein
MQRAQHLLLDTALSIKQISDCLGYDRQHEFAPQLQSERAIAFMLDIANQHGNGGAKRVFQAVTQAHPALSGADLLSALEAESVQHVQPEFAEATRVRREHFRTTGLLSSANFSPDAAARPL